MSTESNEDKTEYPPCEASPKLELSCYLLLAAIIAVAEFGLLNFVPHLLADTILIIVVSTLGTYKTFTSGEGLEKMSAGDAAKFPFMASAALFGLFVTFKYVPEEYIKPLITVYFTLAGWLILSRLLTRVTSVVFSSNAEPLFWIKYPSAKVMGFTFEGFWLVGSEPEVADDDTDPTPVHSMDLVSLLICSPPAYFYWLNKHWILNNLMGIGFCVEIIQLVRPGSFKIVAGLLVALFIYDIFWVFGTEVMVTVATKFDGPIKLLFPRHDADRPSMLGLGDIAIPAFLVSMMARLDYTLDLKTHPKLRAHAILSGRYFWVSLFGYFLGMVICMTSMLYFDAAQPALLYLVPSCLISVSGFALVQGEFSDLWNFEDIDESAKQKED